jgi:hypothetical protein
VCRVFKKRIHHQKSTGQQPNPSKVTILASEEEQSSLISDNQSIDQAYHNFHQVFFFINYYERSQLFPSC